uniref:Uncharacterized protein n=1 Tax=Arundo donax TaxID=35708 RepID=A0A0A9G9F6_ARUDO
MAIFFASFFIFMAFFAAFFCSFSSFFMAFIAASSHSIAETVEMLEAPTSETAVEMTMPCSIFMSCSSSQSLSLDSEEDPSSQFMAATAFFTSFCFFSAFMAAFSSFRAFFILYSSSFIWLNSCSSRSVASERTLSLAASPATSPMARSFARSLATASTAFRGAAAS